MKIAWLLRGSDWRTFHLHRCRECGRRFTDDEPGSWTDYRYDEFPELCSPYGCKPLRSGSRSHTSPHCRSAGPYCPACAARVERELKELREAYRD
jgi:hypothetical protein